MHKSLKILVLMSLIISGCGGGTSTDEAEIVNAPAVIGSSFSGATTLNIANNTLNGLTSTGTGGAVLGISCITNIASGLSDQKLDHADVTQTTASVEHQFSDWLLDVVAQMANCAPV